MFQEEWRPVVGFEDAYEVSNTGRVRSIGRYVKSRWGQNWYNMHELKIQTSKKGYKTVVLHRDGDYYQKQVHRLVAEAFIPNPDNMEQVNHKDTDKANNNVSNLEWITPEENIRHAFKNGCFHRTERQSDHSRKLQKETARKKCICVGMIEPDTGEVIGIFRSIKTAAAILGLSDEKISAVCKGKRKTTGGYNWQYMEER